MVSAAAIKTAPIQKRQSRCILLQYGPASGSPLLLLFPSGLCLFPVIFSPVKPITHRIEAWLSQARRRGLLSVLSETMRQGIRSIVISRLAGWLFKKVVGLFPIAEAYSGLLSKSLKSAVLFTGA